MPASSSDTVTQIEESLKSSFSKGDSLDTKLICSSKKVLLQKIEFRDTERQSSFQLEQLQAKYTQLNASSPYLNQVPGSDRHDTNGDEENNEPHGVHSSIGMNGNKEVGDGLPAPGRVLYPPERLKLEWPCMRRIGPGLYNPANTCFVNSTLQCLTYTPPLANYLCSEEHKRTCTQSDFCLVCELQKHVRRCFSNDNRSFEPTNVIRKLKLIAKHLQYGRQEDAHEFLRYVVEGMQKSCLNGYAKLDKSSKETTVINQIFGGFLRSQVVCLQCKGRSNTFDPALDISLDIKNVQTIQKALEKFVQPEKLDEDNAYNCPKCKRKVPAQKRFSLHRAPNVLTIQLKRFDLNRLHGKITRHIQFPEKLDVRPYMSVRQGDPVVYHLYGVLVHSGFSAQQGHYYSYVRGSNKMWYSMNDAYVNQVNVSRVLGAEAYLLFYVRLKDPPNVLNPRMNHTIGPRLPPGYSAPHTSTKLSVGPIGQPVNDMGTPLSRKAAPMTSTALTSNSRPTTIPSLMQRDKVSFGIKPRELKSPPLTEKPRIVMHIRNGKVDYNSVTDKQKAATTPAAGTLASQSAKGKVPRLVPYNGESSDSEVEPNQGQEQDKHVTQKKPSQNGGRSPDHKTITKKQFEPILDHRLNATTYVPGAYGPLNKDLAGQPQHRRSSDDTTAVQASSSHKVLQRSLSQDSALTICTEPSIPKVNATTKWSVLDIEAEVSPSLASASSSNASMNSTTGWQVTSQSNKNQQQTNGDSEAQHTGWTVTPRKASPRPDKREARSPDMKLNLTLKRNSSSEELHPNGQKTEVAEAPKVARVKTNGDTAWMNGSQHVTAEPPLVNGKTHASECLNGLETATNGYTDSSHKRSKKEKKKHKKWKYADSNEERAHKKKKKKKKKKQHEDERPLLDSDSSDTIPQRKRRVSDEYQAERKRAKFDYVDNNSDYVWVEKTKETIEKAQQKDKEVPVQDWDHHSHKSGECHSGPKAKSGTVWDGSRTNSSVVKELQKMTSRGYGAQVSSWDGGQNHLDQELSWEKSQKKNWKDEYEEELDRGKVKKVKRRPENSQILGHNPFQKYQDDRNADNDLRRGEGKFFSWSQSRDQEQFGVFGASKTRDHRMLYSPDGDKKHGPWASPDRSSTSSKHQQYHHKHQQHVTSSQAGYQKDDHHRDDYYGRLGLHREEHHRDGHHSIGGRHASHHQARHH